MSNGAETAGDGPGRDDAQACVAGLDHVWAVTGIHLSLTRGAETEEQCSRPGCETVRYVTNRGGRPPLASR